MKAPAVPGNEKQRMNALDEYRVLDTAPEPEFDAITELASAIVGAPIALISLVDHDRQWFKSKVGLSACETPRDISFCGHAILEPEVFVVEDAATDLRFADNPLVTGDPKIRFYAGAPLVSRGGQAIGTLCVIDRVPRVLEPSKKAALVTLARMVVAQFELRLKNRELESALQTIEAQKASLIHHSKMSALGEMAGGMAHEINNPLAIISGYGARIGMLLRSPEPEANREKIESSLEGIGKGVERITTIIRGLQLFSREGSSDPLEKADLRRVVRDSLGLCQEHFKNLGIEIRLELPSDPLEVSCRATQVSQILVNLLNNSKDAIRDLPVPRFVLVQLREEQDQIVLSVSDSGPGVPEELRFRVFEPFFTTKPPGSGTGLGLSISRTLARANGADLFLQSEGRGSRFEIRFGAGRETQSRKS
jgi:two-component system NtrC family sensor kinase